jgi:methionyl aminopeptidase
MANINEEGIRNIAIAGNIIYEIFSKIDGLDLIGMRTVELNDLIDEVIRTRKGQPTFLHYRGFPKSACISLNEEVVHGIPDNRQIRNGDLVKIDVGVTYHGFIADAARTFAAGQISEAARKLMDTTKESLRQGIAHAQRGNRVSDISRTIQTTVEKNGFSVVRELTGHGVGRNLHEEPMIPNFIFEGPDPVLQTGMVLAIEPMVNAGAYDVVTASNGWTIKSRDNSLSCHFEDTIAILERGNLNLTRVVET